MKWKGVYAIILLCLSAAAFSQETQPETQKPYPEMPEFQQISQWFNSPPLTKSSLKGKVVLVDFWTYSCINCIRTFPYLKNWYQKYKSQGFVIVGVHSPEFEFEKDPANVKMAIEKYKIPYPVALDNKMATWNAYNNNAWPAHYFVDLNGKIRHVHFGEGEYEKSEEVIRTLLAEKAKTAAASPAKPETLPMNIDFSQIKSPETYLGFLRRERLVTSGRPLELNEWMFKGSWRTEGERIVLKEGTGKIRFRFNANKVNLVLHPGEIKPARAIVRLDGQVVPQKKAGKDVKAGNLEIVEPRLYELVNLGPKGEEHTIEIEFLTPGTAVYAFTFG
jgi:thiol-disulfide isomerase/thioredoxin